VLQYVLGLRRLGVDCVWVDRIGAVDPRDAPHSLDYLTRRAGELARDFGFQDRYCIVYDGGARHFGLSGAELRDVAAGADLLINLGGHLPPDSPLMRIPRRAYIDVDPGFTQIWAGQADTGLERHNHFFTVGQNVCRPGFPIPTGDVVWHPILPPVHLASWPARIDDRWSRFCTVADWRGSQDALLEGEYYGTKRTEFIRYLRVPIDSGQRIELKGF
jgi:hypothetical protein